MVCSLTAHCAAHGLRIEEASFLDGADLRSLLYEVYREHGLHGIVRWHEEHPDAIVDELLADHVAAHLLRDEHDTLAGVSILTHRYDGVPGEGEIVDLHLRRAWRGQGLGRAMLEDLLTHAREQNLRSVYLVTRPELSAAVRLYGRAGFVRIPNERYPTHEDIIEMRITL